MTGLVGFEALIEGVRACFKRPRQRCKREHTPPILGCVRANATGSPAPEETADRPAVRQQPADLSLVEDIADRLNQGELQRRIPHVTEVLESSSISREADEKVAPVTDASVEAVRQILMTLANKLNGTDGGCYKFPRFWLVIWLMAQKFPKGPASDGRTALHDRLFGRAVAWPKRAGVDVEAIWTGVPFPLRLVWILLAPLLFWGRHSGRFPGIGRIYRWFLKQSAMPAGNGTFFELALRLTDGRWQAEEPEEVAKLLVNAFLGDLRDGFRGTGWLRRYRPTFPIVLLGGISRDNGGYTLVRMIAEVRNKTRLFDPLLLITTGTRVPPLATPPPNVASPAVTAPNLIKDWQAQMDDMSRQRDIEAWFIPVVIDTKAEIPPGAEERHLEPVKVPKWRTRLAAAGTIVLVLGLVSGGYAWFGFSYDNRHCGDGFFWLGPEDMTTTVTRIDGNCIGVTDGSNAKLLPGGPFDEVRSTILAQNQRSLAASKDQPYRPLITIVFMSSVTEQATSESVLTAEREQLAGIAVAQAVQLAKPPQTYEPLVKILIANGGPQLKYGARLADQLREMAADDPSIVAVVGMVESRESTAATIRALAGAGLPTVAATLTADSMVAVSKLYYQISPQNSREAAVAAAYLDHLLAKGKDPFGRVLDRSATIYQSDDPTDIYSQNLAADLKASLTAFGIPAKINKFTPSGKMPATKDAGSSGRDACDATGVVLYAARGLVDFQAFLGGIADRCRDKPPYVLAGDDATKYVADRVVSGANKSIPFQYLSLALAPDLKGDPPAAASDFYAQLNDLFPYEKGARGRTLDGHAALSYDAAYTVLVAVSYLRRDQVAINGGTVWSALQSVTDAGGAQRSYSGVTGKIDFGGTIGRRVPLDKPVTIVTFRKGEANASDNLVCGAPNDDRTKPWCPTDQPNMSAR